MSENINTQEEENNENEYNKSFSKFLEQDEKNKSSLWKHTGGKTYV